MDKKFSDYEISSGTLKPQDIVEAVHDFAVFEKLPEIVSLCEEWLGAFSADENSPELGFIMDDIFVEMNEVAEDDYYFGTHEGDGALFGFWKSEYPW